MTDVDDFKVSEVWKDTKKERRVAYGWIAVIVGVFLVFGVVGAGCGIVNGWWSETRRQISPENVKAQFAFAYDDLNSLKASAAQSCTARDAAAAATDPQVQSQRETQYIAIQNNYNRIKGEYDAHLADLFRTKVIRPRDVPTTAPTLTEMQLEVC